MDPDWKLEQQEWLDALNAVIRERGDQAASELLEAIRAELIDRGIDDGSNLISTPYLNTIAAHEQPPYPGDVGLERRIENIIRWNAASMVLQAYDQGTGVGGHIGTYLSASTIMEVGFNHFFRARNDEHEGDQVHVQAHAAPGVYARAWLEGRLTTENIANFRRELGMGGGLPSYPHPRRLPKFWQMPTASMGLSTPCALHQARFARYLEHRGLKPPSDSKVWLFIGDGEADEPEVLGTINLAAQEKLDNLVIVVNCNLQRLDGPVRGNGKIIQELERNFRGAGWHVIKLIWGSDWDPLFALDDEGRLQTRLEELVDGDYQRHSTIQGKEIRDQIVHGDSKVADLLQPLTDEQIYALNRGGHDHQKIYAAYIQAVRVTGKPVVILAKTIKGDGLGSSSAGKNTIHQKKQLTIDERSEFAFTMGIPHGEEEIKRADFYRPQESSAELQYLHNRRKALGGYLPQRTVECPSIKVPEIDQFSEMLKGSGVRELSTTMSLVRMLQRLLRNKDIGKFLVPIVPDEGRTFGMDGLFSSIGIYSPQGQLYTPVDAGTIAPYRESQDGQVLQEGICEVGAMAAFLAAGTAYANFGVPTIPFYFFYSIFGFQRVGDLVWAGGDSMCKGFLIGATSGRTTLNGEGVQHQDGHSQLVALTIPNMVSYDPAFAYELAVIIQKGMQRMYVDWEDVFYYITVTNQNYSMPPMPEGVEEGILKGMYPFEYHEKSDVHLLGSGAVMMEVLQAASQLREMGKTVTIWSVTSYTELNRQGTEIEQQNLHSVGGSSQLSYVQQQFKDETGVVVAVSDYQCALPLLIAPWISSKYVVLGTDGFGLSEARNVLRDHFEVSAPWIVFSTLSALVELERESVTTVERYIESSGIVPTRVE